MGRGRESRPGQSRLPDDDATDLPQQSARTAWIARTARRGLEQTDRHLPETARRHLCTASPGPLTCPPDPTAHLTAAMVTVGVGSPQVDHATSPSLPSPCVPLLRYRPPSPRPAAPRAQQLVNRLEKHGEVCTKSGLAANLSRILEQQQQQQRQQQQQQAKGGGGRAALPAGVATLPWVPETYVLAARGGDARAVARFKEASARHKAGGSGTTWIVKPTSLNRGNGIHVMHMDDVLGFLNGRPTGQHGPGVLCCAMLCLGFLNGRPTGQHGPRVSWEAMPCCAVLQIPRSSAGPGGGECNPPHTHTPLTTPHTHHHPNPQPCAGSSYVVQKYIDAPLLLGGRKFDIRAYVLMDHEGGVWLHREAYVRTSATPYDLSDLSNRCGCGMYRMWHVGCGVWHVCTSTRHTTCRAYPTGRWLVRRWCAGVWHRQGGGGRTCGVGGGGRGHALGVERGCGDLFGYVAVLALGWGE